MSMFACHRIAVGVFVVIALCAMSVQAQTTPERVLVCPTQQGVYAGTTGGWKELPVETAKQEKTRMGTLMHDNAVASYGGDASSLQLENNVSLCVSGSALGSTLVMAKAQVKKHQRRVIIGTISLLSGFTFKVNGKQSVPFQQTRDDNRNYILRMTDLEPGQYMLYLQQGASLSTIPPAFSFMVP